MLVISFLFAFLKWIVVRFDAKTHFFLTVHSVNNCHEFVWCVYDQIYHLIPFHFFSYISLDVLFLENWFIKMRNPGRLFSVLHFCPIIVMISWDTVSTLSGGLKSFFMKTKQVCKGQNYSFNYLYMYVCITNFWLVLISQSLASLCLMSFHPRWIINWQLLSQ